MLHAINRASKQVFLSTYIFRGGSVGESFTEALCHAARRGVDVRLLMDGFGGAVYSLRKPWEAHPPGRRPAGPLFAAPPFPAQPQPEPAQPPQAAHLR